MHSSCTPHSLSSWFLDGWARRRRRRPGPRPSSSLPRPRHAALRSPPSTPLRRLIRERSHTLFWPPLPPSSHATSSASTATPQPHPLAHCGTATGRARMLDGGSPYLAPLLGCWLQHVSHPPDGASGRPPDMPSSPFAFFQLLDYSAALALNLLVCPPALRGERCMHPLCVRWTSCARALHG